MFTHSQHESTIISTSLLHAGQCARDQHWVEKALWPVRNSLLTHVDTTSNTYTILWDIKHRICKKDTFETAENPQIMLVCP